jgi:acetyl esterase/lipase
VDVVTVGPIVVRVHRPPGVREASTPALLWVHRGGFVMGTPAQEDAFCRLVAEQLGVLVAAVAYRRAPEYPFPTPLHDCHDALVWLAQRDDVDASRIAIGGGSAGGGLAAALALLARDRAEVTPVLQLLEYPMLDDRTVLRTDIDERDFRIWNNKANRFGWRSYLGFEPGDASTDGLAAPSRDDNLAGVTRAWIGVGTCDLFHDEDVAYAAHLRSASVPCDLLVVEGAFHGFDNIAPRKQISQRFRAAQLDALTSALGVRV